MNAYSLSRISLPEKDPTETVGFTRGSFRFLVLFCFLLLQLISTSAFGQRWWELINNDTLNYYKVVSELDAFYKNHDHGKGTGYKQYERWKYLQGSRIDSLGNRISANQEFIWREQNRMRATRNSNARTTANVWTELGPKNWNHTSGWNPGVGRITAIEIDPSNPNIIFVGTPSGGCWKSTDGGTSWSVSTDNFYSLTVMAIAVDYSNSNRVYIGCGSNQVMKSNDGGTTWNISNTGLTGNVRELVIHPTTPTLLFAGTSVGLYKSTDAGANWSLVYSAAINDIEFKPGDPSIVYACGTIFLRSINSGTSFTQITSGIGFSDRSYISVSPANVNYVYLVMANGSEFGRLLRSSDSGLNFTTRVTGSAASGTNYFGYTSTGTDPGGQAQYDMAMCVSTTNAEEVYIGGVNCWKSTNGGTSFTAITYWTYPNGIGYNHPDVHVLEYRNNLIYSGTDGGIYKSLDFGDNWIDLSAGLGIRQFYRLGCARTDATLIAGGSQDNGSSIRTSSGWIDWIGADGMETFFDYSNPNIVYGTAQNGALYKSINGGASRTAILWPASNGNWMTPFEIDPITPSFLYVAYVDIYKSFTGGTSWFPITALASGNFTQMAIAPSNPDYIYASKGGSLYSTSDGGTNWSITSIPSGTINYITVHPSNPLQIATASSNGKVYTSSNGGTSWTDYSGSVLGTFYCVVYHNSPNNGLYLSGSMGVYYRNNTMVDWIPFMNGLPNVDVREIEIHYASQKLRAATYGRGIWETDLYDALPVYYVNFDVENKDDHVQVSWTTSAEINNDRFEIQRSHNGRDFQKIGTEKAVGNSTQNQQYEFEDTSPLAGTSYYRLLQYDSDGTGRYTNSALIERQTENTTVFVFPLPSQDYFQLLVSDVNEKSTYVRIFNTAGQCILKMENLELNQIHRFGESLAPGMYWLEVSSEDFLQTLKLVKQ